MKQKKIWIAAMGVPVLACLGIQLRGAASGAEPEYAFWPLWSISAGASRLIGLWLLCAAAVFFIAGCALAWEEWNMAAHLACLRARLRRKRAVRRTKHRPQHV